MVVLHHAVLAYYVKGPLPVRSMVTSPRWWQAFPVVDPAKWSGYTPFVLFNDSYTMSLLFFVSGLFSWRSLKKKGTGPYFRDRLIRLGLPLLFMAVLAPATYYAVYLQGHLQDGFAHEWLALHNWPTGPAWFIMVLLLFDIGAVLAFRFAPSSLEAAGRWVARIRNPYSMVLLMTALTALLFLPSFLEFGFYGAGALFIPFTRIVHNIMYFVVGLALGSATVAVSKEDDSIISATSRLPAHWLPLSVFAVMAFALWQGMNYLSHRHYGSLLWLALTGLGFCLSSAVAVFAVLSICLRFVKRGNPVWNSLLACSFGIYLVHYVIVAWIQYPLVAVHAPGWVKGPLVFCLALGLSWGITAFARRSSRIASFI